ncbi:MAG: hypothetical protein IPI03_02230 [Rubrivivax sp.]|nr:hypothetical protein [Rubrivivax sp.]MBK8526439.1 hypothetical protein [Rubrivivax sp.]
MLASPDPSRSGAPAMNVLAATELQDQLLVAKCDLERLQRLLDDASQALLQHFTFASDHMDAALLQLHADATEQPARIRLARQTLGSAITALQFQDMATQLIAHTSQRLRHCADRLARDALGDDDEDGAALVEPAAQGPNPVTQDEMHAGSIELF